MRDEACNKHSQNVTDVKNKYQKVTGHIPEALGSKLITLMK